MHNLKLLSVQSISINNLGKHSIKVCLHPALQKFFIANHYGLYSLSMVSTIQLRIPVCFCCWLAEGGDDLQTKGQMR